MKDQVRKGRSLKSFPPQEKKMIFPDVMLHTKNVMIPITRPVSLKHSFNVSYSENKPQIVRMQYYKNNPALIFSETPSHTLYNRLENLFEVKRINHWKSKNQNKKYTISGKPNSLYGSKQSSVSQNFCPSRRFSCNRKDNTLHFPNTMLVNYESNNKNLRKMSSKSIKLSRKCDVLQIKKNEKLYENKLVTMPKKTLNNNINKPIVSLPSQSSHDISDSDFTLSTLSMSNFQIENKKTFANIRNRRNSMSRIISNQLHPSNSEYEINVLHYENNISADNLCNTNKSVPDFKYSWKLDRWMPYSRKKEHDNICEIKDVELYKRKPYYDCKIKYSWQIIGTSAQTSYSLLQNLLNNLNTEDKAYKTCSIKYSWQIIGISTQASLHDHHKDSDYWEGMVLTPNKNYNNNKIAQNDNNETDYNRMQDYVKYPEKQLKKYLILNSQQTQTFAKKTIQTDINDINDHCVKYSWHNLIKQYL